METPKLMWVNSDGPEKGQKRLPEIRRHVMMDFLSKPGSTPRAQRKRRHVTKVKQSESLPEPPAVRNHFSVSPTPSTALTSPADVQICNAARWYFQNPFAALGATQLNWCSRRWEHLSTSMWDSACEDEAMREIFMMCAATKEAQVTGSDTTKARLLHQGNAIRLVSKQLTRRSNSLNTAAIVLMSLLSKDAFATSEYEVAEAHMNAISLLIQKRMDSVPWFLWYFIVWTDLTLSGVSDRPPQLPFYVPAECRVQLPQSDIKEAARMAKENVKLVPLDNHFTEALATRLFDGLQRSTLIYNRDDTNWRTASMVYYEACWLCANSQPFEGNAPFTGYQAGRSEVKVILRVMRMVMYGTASPFFSEAGPQHLLQRQTLRHLRTSTPKVACDRWQAIAPLDSLVWVLFNISISVICYPAEDYTLANARQLWLRECLQIAIRRLETKDYCFSWVECLKNFPFTATWHQRWFQPFYEWLKTGVVPDTADLLRIPAPFSNNWKVFTPPKPVAEVHEIIDL